MNGPLPSPYNACTGGVTHRERPPLSPLWRVMYSVGQAHGDVYLRAVDIAELHAEVKRLYSGAVHYMAWLLPVGGGRGATVTYSDTGADEAHGHPGAPHPPA